MESLLKLGSVGVDVKFAQHALNVVGLDLTPLKLDGIFGQKTHKATQGFQRKMGLVGDGVIGPNTLNALGNFIPVLPDLINTLSTMPPTDLGFGDKVPVDVTNYFRIDLSKKGYADVRKRTGIFMPKESLKASATIDMLLFFHGHHSPIVDEYGGRQNSPFQLRHFVLDSKKSVALVVPSLSEGPMQGFRRVIRTVISR